MNAKSLLLGVAIVSTTLASRAGTVVVPNGLASVEGNLNWSYPFSTATPSSVRYQQVHAASEFGSLAAGGEFITQIAFRPQASFSGEPFSFALANVQINLSTTAAGPDGLSSTFAQNIGGNDTVVFGGAPLVLSTLFTGPGEGPKDFDIVINLTTLFFYNPAEGNLLLDIRNTAAGPIPYFLDAESTLGDSISSMFALDVNAATGRLHPSDPSLALVPRFTTVVPEPGSLALMLVGCVLLLYPWRRVFVTCRR